MTNIKIFISVIGVAIVGLVVVFIVNTSKDVNFTRDTKYDAFAQCLKDKGATFYGAFWCPHCKAQKKMFGSSASLLPYVECSTPDGSAQTKTCIDKKIEGYPTWELADGTRLPVESASGVSLETLSSKTSCPLPQ